MSEYFVCNMYDKFKIINVSGYNYTLNDNSKIINYGIHFDQVTKKWLFIIENDKGNFQTYVFDKNKLVFSSDTIRYSVDLSSICFNNEVLFRSGDGHIKGFNYINNSYKDFPCKAINDGARLVKEGNKFIVLNDKEILKVG